MKSSAGAHLGHKWYGFWTSVLKPIGHKLRGGAWEAAHIVDEVFLGSVDDAANIEVLRDELGITHVLSCVMGLRPFYPDDFVYLCLPLRDVPEESLDGHLEAAVTFIDEALRGNGRVFVHCMKGVSRSASMVLAWLISRKGMELDDALALVREKRPLVSPNPGFLAQLALFAHKQRLRRRNSEPDLASAGRLRASTQARQAALALATGGGAQGDESVAFGGAAEIVREQGLLCRELEYQKAAGEMHLRRSRQIGREETWESEERAAAGAAAAAADDPNLEAKPLSDPTVLDARASGGPRPLRRSSDPLPRKRIGPPEPPSEGRRPDRLYTSRRHPRQKEKDAPSPWKAAPAPAGPRKSRSKALLRRKKSNAMEDIEENWHLM